jgi:two-component system response regulator HydG
MSDDPLRVLVIDDEKLHAEAVGESLERVGFDCDVVTSGGEGAKRIENDEYDVVLTDLRMSGVDGLAILRKARQHLPEAEVVVITGHGDVKTAVEAIKEGAANYLTKPVDLVELRAIVTRAAERRRLARANEDLKRQLEEKFGFEGVVGNSPKMHDLIAKLRDVAPTSATVLIHGETGTGKELVAKAIHVNSPRKNKPFVAMNCTALNENLLEDELFGHDPGSFTGADRARKGRFEFANGGTLFLDEVGDMPLSLQAKLLRVLENKEIIRIGSNEPIKVNVRLVSATNRDLEAAVADGSMRRDLYFRLKVVTLRLPPLRERREDIPLLTAHFLKEFNHLHGKRVTAISEPLRRAMAASAWPGNVRQLRNLVESMVVQDRDGTLGMDDVYDPNELRPAGWTSSGAHDGSSSGLIGKPLTEVNRYYIEQALHIVNGNREEAARILGIGERTLYREIQDWKVQDQVQDALARHGGNLEQAAKHLGMSVANLQRKARKWGMPMTVSAEQ